MLSEILIVSEDPSMLAKVSLRYISVARDACVKAVTASEFQTTLLRRKMLLVLDVRHPSLLRKILAACEMLQIKTVTFSGNNFLGVEQSIKALSNHSSVRQLKDIPSLQYKSSNNLYRVA